MEKQEPPRKRRSIYQLQREHLKKENKQLELLLTAFEGIKKLDHTEKNSYAYLAGIHGLNFNEESSQRRYYCEHKAIKFPTWHRAYLCQFEEALRSIPNCQDVTLPYWDVFDPDSDLDPNNPDSVFDPDNSESGKAPVPWVFTQAKIKLQDGTWTENPLHSYTFPLPIFSKIAAEVKQAKFSTVRYPLSGLIGTDAAINFSKDHNKEFKENPQKEIKELNCNINRWLNGPPGTYYGIRKKYKECLKEPTYYYFSHITCSPSTSRLIVPLESPHDSMHDAIGGLAPDFIKENNEKMGEVSKEGTKTLTEKVLYQTQKHSFGEMQFPAVSSFDPIFWFHHSFVDYIFWRWQQIHKKTKEFRIEDEELEQKKKS